MVNITIENIDRTLKSLPGHTLLVSLLNEDIPVHHACGGRARCGCCRIKILHGIKGTSPVNDFEKERLGESLLKQGWRLACQTHMLRDVTIYLPSADELDSVCSQK